MRREVARLREAAERRNPERERTWFEQLPPDVQQQVLLVEREMDSLVARAGPPSEGVHPLHWKGRRLPRSRGD
jgi:hypothetical protein